MFLLYIIILMSYEGFSLTIFPDSVGIVSCIFISIYWEKGITLKNKKYSHLEYVNVKLFGSRGLFTHTHRVPGWVVFFRVINRRKNRYNEPTEGLL
jgi:hypothetical protein